LEGDEATVTSLYAMIENNKRHKDVIIIQKEKFGVYMDADKFCRKI
jgi:Sensors of blue-light using FAD